MGKVLAMKPFKRIMTCAFACLAAACGTAADNPVTQALTAAVAQIGAEREDPMAVLTPEVVGSVTQAFLLVNVPDRDAKATMVIFDASDDRLDWRGGDGRGLVTQGDIIIATRGFGADLFLAETPDLRRNILAGEGTHQRLHRYLDGENRMQQIAFTCRLTTLGSDSVDLIARVVVATKLQEICHSGAEMPVTIENTYWVAGGNRDMMQSEQWIGPEVGMVILQHLVR
jgi:hypothetical protein